MSRRRHRRSKGKGVELNLAAMLDMAFQLLTFFILTFRPAPIEGHLQMNLPPPIAQTRIERNVEATEGASGTYVPPIEALHLSVVADDDGNAVQVKMENSILASATGPLNEQTLLMVNRRLKSVFNIQTVPFDRIQIEADRRLRYDELMKLIDVCSQQKLPDGTNMQKISFTELER